MNEFEKPSIYTKLYWLIKNEKLPTETFFDFLEFFWPTFIKVENFVFLKEKYSSEMFSQLIKEDAKPEYWMNLVTVNDYFPQETDEEKASELAKKLVEIWQTKLKNDFPLKTFKVVYLFDDETGDRGLTFYQVIE